MSEPLNISEFKLQLATVMVKLHSAMPAPITITTDEMSEDGIKWIEKAGLVQGEEGGGLHRFFLHNATLTPHALSMLQRSEQNAPNGMRLGQYTAAVFAESDDYGKQRAAELLARRMLDI